MKKAPTSEQLKKARKAGFKAARPDKPKAGATLTVLENWCTRYDTWVDKVHAGVKKENGKISDEKKRIDLRTSISKR